jgi:hypothetical protein
MSIYKKISIIILQMAWMILCGLPAAGMDADDAPVSVTIDYLQELYEEVPFDHQTHSDMYDCSSCHHHTAGTGTQNETCKKCHAASGATDDVSCSGCHKDKITPIVPAKKDTMDINIYHIDKPSLKGALHLQCLGCHQSESGPTGCQECHAFTQVGRKRFFLKD